VKTSNGTSFQSKVAAFCGQYDGCSRLFSGCVSKLERNMKLEEPGHFQLYSSQKASFKTSAFVVCYYVNPQFALHVRATLIMCRLQYYMHYYSRIRFKCGLGI
jgi:hypothetical protein